MKKLKLTITAIALCFATMTAFANDNEPTAKEKNNAFRSKIVSLLGSEIPVQLTDGKALKASLTLMVNNNNEIIVVSTNSKDASVDTYVKSKLNYKKIDVKGLKKGQVYQVPLTIKQS
ncbi:hypothetical protein [Pseudotenacibaculum haliotis]|uniref:Uncharacterized protein n=1 Tax=Pseudotenacibaculum haliotis TaxID=1862138 RepID=A0ABW5LU41_9FLAO